MKAERLLIDGMTTPAAARADGAAGAVSSRRFDRTPHHIQAPATHERQQGRNLSQITANEEGNEQ